MCSSIREFGFKVPVLARSDGEVVDGHLRIKAARKLGISDLPVITCDEWSPAQVRAFRLLVNRSVTWASWDEELLALELQELSEADFDLDLTGFNPVRLLGSSRFPTRRGPMRHRRFRRIRCPFLVTCGFAERTACSAETLPARRR